MTQVINTKGESTLLSKLDQLPDWISSTQLVSLGLFSSNCAMYLARVRGQSPDYIKIGKKVLYPKSGVIDFIRNHSHDGSIPKHKKPDTAVKEENLIGE